MNFVILASVLALIVRLSTGDDFEDFLKMLEKLDAQPYTESCEDSTEHSIWTKGHGDTDHDYKDTFIKAGIICYICEKCQKDIKGVESSATCDYCMVQKLDAETVTRSCLEGEHLFCTSDSGSCCSTDYCNSQQQSKMSLKMTLALTLLVLRVIVYTQ
ncbi:unnamed protein product [Schistocephalus solidus]|uniref:Conserved secreted protein n=1 Tax=Schistocephalus solidus TaxID=70667 RepID=A0A183SRZ9_SCHSO|nr:unnamed protein product [Schistocephalus solidus]